MALVIHFWDEVATARLNRNNIYMMWCGEGLSRDDRATDWFENELSNVALVTCLACKCHLRRRGYLN